MSILAEPSLLQGEVQVFNASASSSVDLMVAVSRGLTILCIFKLLGQVQPFLSILNTDISKYSLLS